MSYLDDALKLSWYCEECAAHEISGWIGGFVDHPIGDHLEGVSWPIRLSREMPPPRWCWCGRRLPPIGPPCHDPFAIYRCLCGLHLFATKDTVSPGRWAWHLTHMANFQAEMQRRIDAAIADSAPVELQEVPDWATLAVGALADAGLVP